MNPQPSKSFQLLAHIFEQLEQTASSLQMIDILAEFFTKCSAEDARISAYLIKGSLGPDYKGLEFGLAKKLAIKATANAYGLDIQHIEAQVNLAGDLGDVVYALVNTNKKGKLSILDVHKELTKIALAKGNGSQEKKLEILANLIQNLTNIEAKYAIRIMLGTVRLGVAEMTFISALAKALTGSREQKHIIENAYNVYSDLGEVAYRVIKHGLKALINAEPLLGVPIRMMLAQRISSIDEVADHIKEEVYMEYKYDGERIQAHIDADNPQNTILFSRRHDNITHQFPDVIEGLHSTFGGKSAIVEGEVVAIDKANGALLPFQILMQRRRKHDIQKYVQNIPVCFMLFDILCLNKQSLLSNTLRNRKKMLEQYFKQKSPISIARYMLTHDTKKMEDFFNTVTKEGAEGVMIKDSSAGYSAGARGWQWIKFKKDYQSSTTDSFDLVVVGGLFGAGRRKGTYGSLLLASFDPKTNKYYTFTKVGAGLTDENLRELRNKLDKYKIAHKHRLLETNMVPDVWFEPIKVLEVSGAEITISQVHTTARDKVKHGGLALRFPRFLRWRDDKSPTQATTCKEIYDIYTKK